MFLVNYPLLGAEYGPGAMPLGSYLLINLMEYPHPDMVLKRFRSAGHIMVPWFPAKFES